MTQQAKISTAASVILHILAFIVFAGVKLYTELNVESEMPVTFVEERKTRPLRRSIPVRPMVSLDEPIRNQPQEEQAIRPDHILSVVFYTDAPEKVFSAVKSVGHESLKQTGIMKRPSVGMRQHMINPMATEILKEPHLRGIHIQPCGFSGRDLLKDIEPVKASPSLNNILRRFAEIVRRRIESKKRYPLAAERAGIEGRTGIRMTILKDGRLDKAEIMESSGYEILDKAALQSVRRAAPFPPIPQEAERDSVQMSIYLVFEIT